jgi:hypothetical protein
LIKYRAEYDILWKGETSMTKDELLQKMQDLKQGKIPKPRGGTEPPAIRIL